MITELLMQHGSFSVPLRDDTPFDIWERISGTEDTGDPTTVGSPGHVVITPQELEPIKIGGVAVLAAARYTGVITRKIKPSRRLELTGSGLLWWLQSPEGLSDIIRPLVTLSTSTIDNALTQLLPAAITKGTVTEPVDTVSGNFHFVSPLEAIRTVMASAHCEFRINPDGTIDAAKYDTLFNITTPTVIASRDQSGSDPNYTGIPILTPRTVRDYSLMASGGLIFTVAEDGTKTQVNTVTRGTSERDLHGNTSIREFAEETRGAATGDEVDYLESRLSEYVTTSTFSLETDYYEIEGGMPVGDAWHVYDPPAFVDRTNPINFRGDVIYPMDLRVIEATWPLRDGMGVYYRPSTGTGTAGAVLDSDWINLTRFVAWEATSKTRIILVDLTDWEELGG